MLHTSGGAFCCSCFHLPVFLSPAVRAARPGGRADHGAAVREYAAGIQRGAVQEAHCHAQTAQEALPGWRGQWHSWKIGNFLALGWVEKWVLQSPCSSEKHPLCVKPWWEREELGVQWSVSSAGCRFVAYENRCCNFKNSICWMAPWLWSQSKHWSRAPSSWLNLGFISCRDQAVYYLVINFLEKLLTI